jgi:hypothetical protein
VRAFAVANPGPAQIVAVTHGVAGLAIVALIPANSVVAQRGRRRRRAGRGAGLALAVLVTVVLASGLLHSQEGFRQLLVVTPMQLHVGAGVVVLAVLAAHLKVHPTRPRRTDATRRTVPGGGALGDRLCAGWPTRAAGTDANHRRLGAKAAWTRHLTEQPNLPPTTDKPARGPR